MTSRQAAFDHKIRAAVLLSRPPLLTRDLTDFEKSFFFYQRRLNERLALPFTRYFYYQRGTPGDLEWKRKIRERLTASRDIGKFTGYSQDTWNDEILTGDNLSEPDQQVEALIRDAQDKEGISDSQTSSRKEDNIDHPISRLTDADRKNDTRSLNRAMSETLYLVVKGPQSRHGKEGWILPESGLDAKEDLRMVSCLCSFIVLRSMLTRVTGSRKNHLADWWYQHEHLDSGKYACGTPNFQVYEGYCNTGSGGRENILHES